MSAAEQHRVGIRDGRAIAGGEEDRREMLLARAKIGRIERVRAVRACEDSACGRDAVAGDDGELRVRTSPASRRSREGNRAAFDRLYSAPARPRTRTR